MRMCPRSPAPVAVPDPAGTLVGQLSCVLDDLKRVLQLSARLQDPGLCGHGDAVVTWSPPYAAAERPAALRPRRRRGRPARSARRLPTPAWRPVGGGQHGRSAPALQLPQSLVHLPLREQACPKQIRTAASTSGPRGRLSIVRQAARASGMRPASISCWPVRRAPCPGRGRPAASARRPGPSARRPHRGPRRGFPGSSGQPRDGLGVPRLGPPASCSATWRTAPRLVPAVARPHGAGPAGCCPAGFRRSRRGSGHGETVAAAVIGQTPALMPSSSTEDSSSAGGHRHRQLGDREAGTEDRGASNACRCHLAGN